MWFTLVHESKPSPINIQYAGEGVVLYSLATEPIRPVYLKDRTEGLEYVVREVFYLLEYGYRIYSESSPQADTVVDKALGTE
jgi:hypothetical protein